VSARTLRRPLGPDRRGFTLIEVILAVSIVAVVVLLATAGLRVGLRAWETGQRRADLQQESRALVELISESLAGTFPYQGRRGLSPERVVLFHGEPEAVHFVTSAPPLTLDVPAAPFHAVVLGRKENEALTLIERLVPADDPFAAGPERVLSRSVTRFSLAYRDEDGNWQERWDAREAGGLPTAVRFELVVGSLVRSAPSVIIALPLGQRTQPSLGQPTQPPLGQPTQPPLGQRPQPPFGPRTQP
jgi:prepilin-type N-terminal cleavage/methylation domain-containing protein